MSFDNWIVVDAVGVYFPAAVCCLISHLCRYDSSQGNQAVWLPRCGCIVVLVPWYSVFSPHLCFQKLPFWVRLPEKRERERDTMKVRYDKFSRYWMKKSEAQKAWLMSRWRGVGTKWTKTPPKVWIYYLYKEHIVLYSKYKECIPHWDSKLLCTKYFMHYVTVHMTHYTLLFIQCEKYCDATYLISVYLYWATVCLVWC